MIRRWRSNEYPRQVTCAISLKGRLVAYSRAIRRIGVYFNYQIEALSEAQLTEYFHDLLDSHSWSAVKLDLCGLKLFYTHCCINPGPIWT